MIKDKLYNKLLNYDFEAKFKELGYAYFTKGNYNLNIIGVRRKTNGRITNIYDDYIVIIYKTPTKTQRRIYSITTEPGAYWMQHFMNPKGTAILVPGQYRGCWVIDKHKGKYEALCQRKAIKVYRDNNKDDIYDLKPETIENGVFGINIHRSNEFCTVREINKYSAGCQVFQSPNDFANFMILCRKQRNTFGNTFTYTLIREEDL